MPATKISLENAKKEKLFYFVANVVVYRKSDQRCLILKRGEREKVHPGRWALPGGKLEWNDLDLAYPTRMNGDVIDFEQAVEDLLIRETREEAGIDISPHLVYLNSIAFVRPDEIPVILLNFASQYLSGDVAPEAGSFTDYQWVNENELQNYSCIDGVPEEILQTLKHF